MPLMVLYDIAPDYTLSVERAIEASGFWPFRVDPAFRKETAIPVRPPTAEIASLCHIFSPPEGARMEDLPTLMKELMIRMPADIREVLALGPHLTDERLEYAIYAPHLTGSRNPNTVLKIERHPEWQGPGLAASTINSDDGEYPCQFSFIGFSVG